MSFFQIGRPLYCGECRQYLYARQKKTFENFKISFRLCWKFENGCIQQIYDGKTRIIGKVDIRVYF